MKKKPALDLDLARVIDLTVAGVRVRVHVDSAGRPLSAWADLPDLPDPGHERLVTLAAHDALEALRQHAQQGRRRQSSANAAATSARKRAAASIAHWANKYLARAHAEHPRFGKARLAQAARRLAAKNKKITLAKRDEITVDRAQQFLDRLRDR